jgi:hypothetical protein
MESFCKPVAGGVWATKIENGFGSYTPCAADICVVTLSHIVLCCLMGYRLRQMMMAGSLGFKRFHLLNPLMAGPQIFIAICLAIIPIVQIGLGISFVNADNIDGESSSLPPYEVWSRKSLSSLSFLSYLWSSISRHSCSRI